MRHTSNKFLKEMVQEVLLEQGTNSYNWEESKPGEIKTTEPETASDEPEVKPAENPAAAAVEPERIKNLYDCMNANAEPMTIVILHDGRHKKIKINGINIFSIDIDALGDSDSLQTLKDKLAVQPFDIKTLTQEERKAMTMEEKK